jgi:preprotein translocase subunit SecE
VGGKLLLAAWNLAADWPDAVRAVPMLIQYGEDERAGFALIVGAVLGLALVFWYYRKESVRNWAGEVASELSRVTWPNKETVTNGTMVVLVATLVATVYVAILDRFWGYLTNLVYGA